MVQDRIIKLVDGDNNENIDWGSPDPDIIQYLPTLIFFVPAGNNQIRIEFEL
jgi:hypothetical protein